MADKRKIRVGAVSYLNTRPLVHRLTEIAPHADVIFDLPSRLAEGLAAGRYDVALIPSIEFFQQPNYTIVSDACIACRGPVLSVKLLFRRPPREVRRLALDEGSRTSVALARILLSQRFGVEPQLEPLPIGAALADTTADAVLLIGDRAIAPPTEPLVETWDLGEEWTRWSGLPFVFAMWTAPAGVALEGLDIALGEARDAGLAELEPLAAAPGPLPPSQCLTYLRDNLYFFLGERELRGLELFLRHAVRLGLAPAAADVRFYDCQTT